MIEGDREPGARPYRVRIPVIWDGVGLVDVEEFNDDVPFVLQRSASLISQLAVALGAARMDAATHDIDFDMEAFLEELEEDVYKNEAVMFEVQHREWTSKDKKRSGVSDDPSSFAPAEALDEDEPEEVAEEVEAEETPEPPKKAPKPLRRR